MSTAVTLPSDADKARVETRAASALRMVEAMTIESDDDYQLAGQELTSIKAKWKETEEHRQRYTVPLNALLAQANGDFKPHLTILERAETIIKRKMIGYTDKVARAAEEQRREAERAAKAERERLEAAAAEQRRLAEAAQPDDDGVMSDEAVAAARAAEQAAAALTEAAAVVVAAPVAIAAPKAAGTSIVRKPEGRVTDHLALLQYIVDTAPTNPAMLELAPIDMAVLRKHVAALGYNLKWPGVTIVESSTMRAR